MALASTRTVSQSTTQMKTCTLVLAAAAAVTAMVGSSANASLIGTSFNATVSHDGIAGGVAGPSLFNHTYGGVPTVVPNTFFGSFLVASPMVVAGYDNAIMVDFSLFNYSGFIAPAPATGTITITGLAENVAAGSAVLIAGATGVGPNVGSNFMTVGSTLVAHWSAASIYTPDASPDAFVLAWNSVPAPAPGALALLGMAGLVGVRRRRVAK